MELKNILKQISAYFENIIAQTREEVLGKENIRDITFNQYIYLEKIKEMNNPTYSELSKKLNVTKPSVTEIINKLIKLDYIEKKMSKHDKRVYNLFLTKKALNRFKAEDTAFEIFAEFINKKLNKNEVKQLKKLFKKILIN